MFTSSKMKDEQRSREVKRQNKLKKKTNQKQGTGCIDV